MDVAIAAVALDVQNVVITAVEGVVVAATATQ